MIEVFTISSMDSLDISSWPCAKGLFNSSFFINHVEIDSRKIQYPSTLFVALKGSLFDGHEFISDALSRGCKCLIINENFSPPPCDAYFIKVQDTLKALQDLATFYRKKKSAYVIAITGSQGKTMCKDLLYYLLGSCKKVCATKESFNSQIGVALSLFDIEEQHEVAIIEAGISHIGEMDVLSEMIMPQMAILTSINENASTLPNKELIITEKCKLLQKVPLNYPVIAPCEIEGKIDNPLFISFNSPCSQLPHAKQIDSYSINHLNYQINYKDTSSHTLKWFNPFDGAIHLINAALKTSFILGLTKDHIVNLLQNYQSEPMQQEIFSVHQGPTFINCTYAQDPSSIINALKNAKRFNNGRLFFLFGGLKGIKVSLEEQLKKINWVFENSFVNKILPFEESNLEERLFDLQQTLAKDDTVIIQGMKKIPLEFLLKCLGDSIEGNRLTVNLSSICHNLKKLNLGQSFMAMVKANAYGTDSVILGKYLQSIGVNLLGVAHPDEGISLKRKAIKQDIFVIHSGLDEIKKIVQWDFEVGVSSYEMILALQKECENLNKKIKVHLHVDTGMTRLGCSLNECVDFAYAISNQQNLIFQGLMTHFACADSERQDDFTYLQIERFKTCIEKLKNKNLLPPFIHAANSSAAMRKLLPEGNLIRVGLGMYGISNLSQEELKTSLTLTSRIVAINYCKKGDTISYGRTYTVDRDTAKIAIIPLGYFDGLQRHFSGKSWFLVRGKKAFMVGIICMDFMMLDVSDIEGVEVGDMVLVFGIDCHGNCRNVEDFASEVGTCPHELITCLGPRIQRLFIEN